MDTFDSYVLFMIVALPLVGAGALMAIPAYRPQAIRWTASLVALAVMLLSFYTFFAYDHSEGGFQFIRTWQWLELPGFWPLGEQAITLSLGIDGIAAPMILLSGIVMFSGVLVSWNIADRNKDYFILYFMLLSGVFGVFTSLDMFFLFFFYELAVLPMYLLIGVWGSSTDFRTFIRTKEYSAMKLVMYLVAGSVLIWIAILAIFVEAGLGTFSILDLEEASLSGTFQRVFLPLSDGGIRRAGGAVALPHLVARWPCSRTYGGEHGPRRGADEAGRLRHHSTGDAVAASGR